MKKLVLSIFAAAMMLSSCNKSIDEKAEMLIEDNLTENITDNITYTPLETKIDSAYTPMENPELYKLFDKYVKATNDLMKHHRMISEMQTKMGKYTDMYSDSLIAGLGPIIQSLESYVAVMENIDRMLDTPRRFVGYRAVHTYKVNVNGHEIENKDFFMFNNDLSSIEYQMRYSKYELVSKELEKMRTGLKGMIETYRNTIEIARNLTE